MSRDLGRDVPDLEKLYARKLWADFSYPTEEIDRNLASFLSSSPDFLVNFGDFPLFFYARCGDKSLGAWLGIHMGGSLDMCFGG